MSKGKKIFIAVSIILLVILILVALLFRPQSELSKPIQFSSVTEKNQLANKAFQETSAFHKAIIEKQSNYAKLNLDEKSVNAYIQTSPEIQNELGKIGAQDFVVKLHRDLIKVGMRITVNGIMLPGSIDVAIRQNVNNKLIVDITSVKIGSYPAPKSIADKVKEKLLKYETMDLPAGYRKVKIEEGSLLIEANPQAVNIR